MIDPVSACCNYRGYGLWSLGGFGRGKAFGRKGARVVVGCRVSGFFDCGAHGEAVSTFAQNDGVWVGLVKTDNSKSEQPLTPI